MRYSVQIDNSISAIIHCLRRIESNIDIWDWNVRVNGGGIDYGVYFNFNLDEKELEFCNQPRYEELDSLDDIIDTINECYGEEDEE